MQRNVLIYIIVNKIVFQISDFSNGNDGIHVAL